MSDEINDLQEAIKKRPTVDELLKLLNSTSASGFKRSSPPPVPPKPKQGLEITIETARRNLGLLPPEPSAISPNRTFLVEAGDKVDDGAKSIDADHHHYEPCVSRVKLDSSKLDSNTLSDQLTSRLRFYENNQPNVTKLVAAPTKSHGGCVVYNSAAPLANNTYQHQPSMANSVSNSINNGSYAIKSSNPPHHHLHHRAEPFVTESPEEANNNNVIRPAWNGTSTVEILEVPVAVGQLSRENHGNLSNNATVNTESLSMPKDIISHCYDDDEEEEDDYDQIGGTDIDDLINEPPRSSTPTSNNNRSEQPNYLGRSGAINSDSNNSDENTLNLSRETDELINNSAHNQSGCELIGINDLSDPKNSSGKLEQATHEMSASEERRDSEDLRKLVGTLQGEVENLNSKLSSLTNRVEYLENKSRANVPNVSTIPTTPTTTPLHDGSLSMKRLSTSYQSTPRQNYSTLTNSARRAPQPARSYNSISKSQVKNANIYTSTSSLYADSNKSGSASISPTPSSYLNLTQQKRDASAYTSMMSLSSIGNSTLKNWPSMNNFIDSEHQAKDLTYDEDEQVIRMVLYNTSITMRVPSALRSSYHLDGIVMEPPAIKLKLEWVHGYRGIDCRSNIHYLPTGECVYFVASVVVLYNPDEKTQRHYLGHTDSVKCLAIHPNRLIVASGQSAIANRRDKRPIVRVWNTVSLATLRVIGFNEDFDRSICCLAFSKHDAGATLAVVDESSEHTITLLDWQREKNWRVAEVNSGHERVLAIDFHPIDKYSLVAVGKSSINFWDIRGMTLAKKAGLFDKYDRPKYVLCLTFNDIGETITGDSNGNIIIWPRGTNKPRRIIREIHPGGVFSVLAMKDGRYLTGGHDRRIVEWDENFEPTGRQAELPEHCGGVRFITYARSFQVFIGTLRNAILMGSIEHGFEIIVQGHTKATSALAMHPFERKYLTGGFDSQLHCIDAETHLLEWSKCLTVPITAASFSPNGVVIIIGSKSGEWLALDAITQDVLFAATDGTGTVNCIKFSPNGEYFCLASSDCQVYVYKTNPEGSLFMRIGACVGHSAPIREVDWSDDNLYIQSQSMNFELKFWRAQNCRPVDSEDIVHDLKWATHNCTIGFNVIGLWSDSIDSALINYCDRSNNDKFIVSATDTGYINIYRWPTYYNRCLSQRYYANMDKLNFIKFLFDDSSLIAVGAESCATTEWSVFSTDEDS